MKHCVDEGTLQAWSDGELPADQVAQIAAHLQACVDCAAMARVIEAENLILSEGLASEFAAPIPSEQLRQRVNAAVAQIQAPVRQTLWQTINEFFGSFRPLAYASVVAMILIVAIVGFVYLKNQKGPSIAHQKDPQPVAPASKESPEQVVKQPVDVTYKPDPSKSPELAAVNPPKPARRRRAPEPNATSLTWQERQYENAIAKLDEALKTQPPMRPALQVDYEYNMAVIDNAIKTTRDAAKKNPKDPLANQFMLAAYQSKVDFMNQVADARGMEK